MNAAERAAEVADLRERMNSGERRALMLQASGVAAIAWNVVCGAYAAAEVSRGADGWWWSWLVAAHVALFAATLYLRGHHWSEWVRLRTMYEELIALYTGDTLTG